mmetsp:Transcript_39739/g.88308  ORF Transcript_39739/g.88308 Transcript_39739/m.88308 type:complete len:379 (+) Transcript_39739:205-1341(+)|eukprot:CAMPEP_0202912554 /NCGR_PEP_ID=MMETSP1392-20130828/58083_1 /ASSEMBLY_ACC=CAM_ASM_000868 /TAXON_ID=225041 /ORGANISM="Chlamydomonas chlamydogama, Strain SAG 11-48b" /LENGTH=378 /DNA_ID=CAMNT_0049603511 /DNA_START=151 /DNA_END=1287 /DNA_ORIENTATION=+
MHSVGFSHGRVAAFTGQSQVRQKRMVAQRHVDKGENARHTSRSRAADGSSQVDDSQVVPLLKQALERLTSLQLRLDNVLMDVATVNENFAIVKEGVATLKRGLATLETSTGSLIGYMAAPVVAKHFGEDYSTGLVIDSADKLGKVVGVEPLLLIQAVLFENQGLMAATKVLCSEFKASAQHEADMVSAMNQAHWEEWVCLCKQLTQQKAPCFMPLITFVDNLRQQKEQGLVQELLLTQPAAFMLLATGLAAGKLQAEVQLDFADSSVTRSAAISVFRAGGLKDDDSKMPDMGQLTLLAKLLGWAAAMGEAPPDVLHVDGANFFVSSPTPDDEIQKERDYHELHIFTGAGGQQRTVLVTAALQYFVVRPNNIKEWDEDA